MSFQLPSDRRPELAAELTRASVGGGPDNMPWPTDARVENDILTVRREVNESGFLIAPWDIPGFGRLIGTTGTLIERGEPYPLTVELARGKINQLRAYAADWEAAGFELPSRLVQQLHEISVTFSRAISHQSANRDSLAQAAMESGYRASHELVQWAIEAEFERRHRRQGAFGTNLNCRLDGREIEENERAALLEAFNQFNLTMSWHAVEPTQGMYAWDPFDSLLDWARKEKVSVTAGPLIDFSPSRLPDWLWLWRDDLTHIASFACDYITATLKRYGNRIRSWELCTASNLASVLSLGEEELLWLTARLVETARQVDPGLDLIVGIAQPWGEYMSREDRTHSPFIFADTLIRAGLSLAALDLEIVMGVTPRGSYCRDMLELSRLLDLYSLLGAPLHVTLGYPSAVESDPNADPELSVDAGFWGSAPGIDSQSEWAAACGRLVLSKPYVHRLGWIHWSDADAHQFPWCGLIDAAGKAKPTLRTLASLRREHLR